MQIRKSYFFQIYWLISNYILNVSQHFFIFLNQTKHLNCMVDPMQLTGFIVSRFLQDSNSTEEGAPEELPSYETSHINMMPYLWTIVIDIAIIFALFKFQKFSIFIHGLIALFVSLTTLITSIPILIEDGIPSVQNDYYSQRHSIIGLIIIILIFIQVLMGIITRILQFIRWSHPYLIYILNVLHKYLGYALAILCKIQVFLILSLDEQSVKLFWGLIASECVLFIVWLLIKIFYLKYEETIMPSYDNLSIPQVESLSQLKQNTNVAVFANYVYNMDPLVQFHPCGYRIIDSVKGHQLDRFMYGMYPSERYPLIPPNSHGYKSMSLLQQPIAKINIPSVYSGLEVNTTEVELVGIQLIQQKCSIYQLKFRKRSGNFKFNGYTSLRQLGRYFSLTADNTITRLYTTVGFLDPANKQFLINSVNSQPQSTNSIRPSYKNRRPIQQVPDSQRVLQQNYVSLLVKHYSNGKMTTGIVKGSFHKYQLSESRGEGLNLFEQTPGKIIIVAGGTGLYPFSDFIDLLYKDLLTKLDPLKKNQILFNNPILESKPFQNFTFHLLLAVNHIEDIHPLTLMELVELSKRSQSFRLTMRVGNGGEDFKAAHRQYIFQTVERFDTLIIKQMESEWYTKVWICGPPLMATAIVEKLDQNKISADKYLFV